VCFAGSVGHTLLQALCKWETQLNPLEVIQLKKNHLARLANQNGATGEIESVKSNDSWVPRPKGQELKNLIQMLEAEGVVIKRSSFDAVSLPEDVSVNFNDVNSIKSVLHQMTFIEIKTANQDRVKEDFSGFFFALTESEISAAEALGERHKVALFNKKTSQIVMTSVPDIINRARSMTWQVSVQL